MDNAAFKFETQYLIFRTIPKRKMEDLTIELKKFVQDFFDNERYLRPESSPLAADEMKDFRNRPGGFQNNRTFMDRLLDDPEALESIPANKGVRTGHLPDSRKAISLEEARRNYSKKRPLRLAGGNNLKMVAASAEVSDPGSKEAIQVEDDALEGFLQIIEYKDHQYMVSGHFILFTSQKSIRLILPGGQTVENFREEEGLLTFRKVVKDKIDLLKICYELY